MDRVLLLFVQNYCINMDEVYFIRQTIEDTVPYLTFYFKNDKHLEIPNATIADIYRSMREQIKEQR